MSWLFIGTNWDPVPGADNFNGYFSKWDVSSVTNMNYMFYYASSFDGDISAWDVSRVTTMWGMFSYASSFNRDISKWDVLNVDAMVGMFAPASSFKHTLCGKWLISRARGKDGMFKGSGGKLCTPLRSHLRLGHQSQ